MQLHAAPAALARRDPAYLRLPADASASPVACVGALQPLVRGCKLAFESILLLRAMRAATKRMKAESPAALTLQLHLSQAQALPSEACALSSALARKGFKVPAQTQPPAALTNPQHLQQ